MAPALSIDTRADAGYVQLSEHSVVRTEQFGPSVLVDLDSAGEPVGLEILPLTADVDTDAFAARYGLPEDTRRQLAAVLSRAVSARSTPTDTPK